MDRVARWGNHGLVLDYSLLFEAITAVATLAVPVVVAVIANRFNNRLKQWEASQWRNQELIRARLDYYRELVPRLNDQMCYFTFVGGWKEFTPVEIITAKRSLDKAFYCAAPLFDDDVLQAYDKFMGQCFSTHNAWGMDAMLKTSLHRRKPLNPNWDDAWDKLFTIPEKAMPIEELEKTLAAYNTLIGAFARNIELSSAHEQYVGPNINFARFRAEAAQPMRP